MRRLLLGDGARDGDIVTVVGADVRHVSASMRMRAGDTVDVGFMSEPSRVYRCVLEGPSGPSLKMKILGSEESVTEPDIKVTLFQGISKAEHMALTIMKCVELGVHRVVPVPMARSVVRLGGGAESEAKRARWQKVALEASKQCGRGAVPEIWEPTTVGGVCGADWGFGLRIALYEREGDLSLKDCLRGGDRDASGGIGLFCGPEGGYEDGEIGALKGAGFIAVSLGPRVLRTETAPIAAMAVLMYEFGGLDIRRQGGIP
ncbi:MAG: 16S rRNA (uracil(1498)-N(3))-methyltransferase [Oscillospiraceae bacterium]|nr:16S rRNA (uracil(1498)-N(3))-methyltransferase [Oscillospiraceae bacterium]